VPEAVTTIVVGARLQADRPLGPIAMPPSVHSDLWDRLQSLSAGGIGVERELPSGGMSRLFLATDLSLDRSVVVKVLPPELAGEVNAARFQREIAVAARLPASAHLCRSSARAPTNRCSTTSCRSSTASRCSSG
jgi:hypothetical protein